MLILSKAALKYAVDVCTEKKTSIIIGALTSMECKRVSETLDKIIEYKDYFKKKIANSPYMTYYYKNGSTIIVIPATISARGYKCNTLIIQKEILNTPEYKDKFLAMECLGYGETFNGTK